MCEEVGRGRANPIGLEIGPEGVRGCPYWGGRESGIPMPRLLPSLKLECEKLASEKTEMQRHYVMVRRVVKTGRGGGESGEEGLAVSGNTWGVNPKSSTTLGQVLGLLWASFSLICKVGCLGF